MVKRARLGYVLRRHASEGYDRRVTHRMRKWIIAAAAILIGLPVAALAGALLVGRATIAPLAGKLELPGLSAPVDIVRDLKAFRTSSDGH